MSEDLREEVAELRQEVRDLKKSVEDLVLAWNTAKGMTAFVKWLASLAIAGGVIYALIAHGKVPPQ